MELIDIAFNFLTVFTFNLFIPFIAIHILFDFIGSILFDKR